MTPTRTAIPTRTKVLSFLATALLAGAIAGSFYALGYTHGLDGHEMKLWHLPVEPAQESEGDWI